MRRPFNRVNYPESRWWRDAVGRSGGPFAFREKPPGKGSGPKAVLLCAILKAEANRRATMISSRALISPVKMPDNLLSGGIAEGGLIMAFLIFFPLLVIFGALICFGAILILKSLAVERKIKELARNLETKIETKQE